LLFEPNGWDSDSTTVDLLSIAKWSRMNAQRVILIYVVKGQFLRPFEPPAHATPYFHRDNRTNKAKSLFELAEPFPRLLEFISEESKDRIHIRNIAS
jgi:hypothetical protein